jgi:hypothetical protein
MVEDGGVEVQKRCIGGAEGSAGDVIVQVQSRCKDAEVMQNAE